MPGLFKVCRWHCCLYCKEYFYFCYNTNIQQVYYAKLGARNNFHDIATELHCCKAKSCRMSRCFYIIVALTMPRRNVSTMGGIQIYVHTFSKAFFFTSNKILMKKISFKHFPLNHILLFILNNCTYPDIRPF